MPIDFRLAFQYVCMWMYKYYYWTPDAALEMKMSCVWTEYLQKIIALKKQTIKKKDLKKTTWKDNKTWEKINNWDLA
jgi:hypothetical protein